MAETRQISRLLEDEHRMSLELLSQLEARIVRMPRGGPATDAEFARLAARVAAYLERELLSHFDFEEQELFPLLASAGDGDIAALLIDEHSAIREVARELLPLVRAAGGSALEAAAWPVLTRTALELVERQVAHIQKES